MDNILSLIKQKITRNGFFSLCFSVIFSFFIISFFYFIFYELGVESIKNSSFFYLFFKYNNISFISLVVIFILLFLFFYLISNKWSSIYIFSNKEVGLDSKNIDIHKILKLFDFQGILRDSFNSEKAIFLNASPEGMLTKNRFHNFILEFKARIFYGGFGIILCADDFDNYFMFKINLGVINKDDNIEEGEKFNVVSHVKKNGFWDIQNSWNNNEFINVANEGDELLFIIKREKKIINLKICKDNGKKFLDLNYLLPSNFPSLPSSVGKEGKDVPLHTSLKTDFPFGEKVGFRAYGSTEKVVITELKIRKIKNGER